MKPKLEILMTSSLNLETNNFYCRISDRTIYDMTSPEIGPNWGKKKGKFEWVPGYNRLIKSKLVLCKIICF